MPPLPNLASKPRSMGVFKQIHDGPHLREALKVGTVANTSKWGRMSTPNEQKE